ncbi:putative NAD/FAD-binding protein [Methylopila capsulata]|uniref:NAD/FAD-binding protein n=1 Tax=Methylopila capsulata TaxID=61654 RepID=A0A9W6IYS1_9HYPH|nr:putative NAD/FAD-binding protein [Methylopila capsulata]GLK57591.1 NAD/FAD-binding protein [Methylopila capsulata]
MTTSRLRIAVVGAGISGAGAAFALHPHHDVTVYEREPRPGGHSHTVDVDYDGVRIAVDTGFIVYNGLNYPNLTALFDHLGVATKATEMSFGLSLDRGAFEWSGKTLSALFAQRRNLVAPSYLWMLREVVRFNRLCVADKAAGALVGLSLGDWLDKRRFARRFREDYLAPMAAAIWSTPAAHVLDFPAESFVAFFANHRLINYERPIWRTVEGGSRSYVEKLNAPFRDRLRLGAPVASIARDDLGVTVTDAADRAERFDQVVLGSHTDESLRLLTDASDAERAVLGAIRYRPNDVWLHRDARLMPRRKAVWSAWNYLGSRTDPAVAARDVAVTYWMNELQGIDPERPLFVTLNPPFEPDPALTFARFRYDHPQYDAEALAAQRRLPEIQGKRRTWFCGAWTGYGFHEDGLSSGLAVAEALGAAPPWRAASFAEAAE